MPLTVPSHAAAVLPFFHLPITRRLSASALVLGSTAPDLIYLLGLDGHISHQPLGLFIFCLPVGLLAFISVESLFLPVLGHLFVSLFRPSHRLLLAPIFCVRAMPKGLVEWLGVGISILIGAITHQLWDGFTHEWMWPARILYQRVTILFLGRAILLSSILQHSSSILGFLVVIAYLWYCRSKHTKISLPSVSRIIALKKLLFLLVLPVFGSVVAFTIIFTSHSSLLTRVWHAAWSALAWFLLLLWGMCLGTRVVTAKKNSLP